MRKLGVFIGGMALVVSACGGGHKSASPRTATPTAPTTTAVAVPPGASYVATPAVSPLQYSASPGGPVVATVPTVTWGGPTYRPIVSQNGTWVQIQLDTRPNQSTGWVPRSSVTLAMTDSRIVISISQRSLTLFQHGQATYTAPVGVGRPQWPTPLGRTFVDAVVATPKFQLNTYGPTVLILGLHSDVFKEFEGGDGVVAIHGYPSDPSTTKGVASTHGCIRASPETINVIDKVPLGSPVDVVA